MVRKKNTKKHQQPEERVEAPVDDAPAAAPVDVPSTPISSSPEEGPSTTPAAKAKKKYRPSHSEIKDYHFNDDQIQTLIDFLKENPCIYNKKDKEYHNNQLKIDLWNKCAQLFPGCSYLQVRKFFEKKRTAFGKIEAAEMKSGAEARARTAREQEIMTTWGFFRGHIAHAQTTSSQIFSSGPESSDASDASGLSTTSIQRRRNLKKRRMPEADPTPPPAPTPTPPPPQAAAVRPGERLLDRMLERANVMMQQPPRHQMKVWGPTLKRSPNTLVSSSKTYHMKTGTKLCWRCSWSFKSIPQTAGNVRWTQQQRRLSSPFSSSSSSNNNNNINRPHHPDLRRPCPGCRNRPHHPYSTNISRRHSHSMPSLPHLGRHHGDLLLQAPSNNNNNMDHTRRLAAILRHHRHLVHRQHHRHLKEMFLTVIYPSPH